MSSCVVVRLYLNYSMILCIIIGAAWSLVACSFIELFFAFYLEIVCQDII
jgi:hypothetical protein